MHGLCVAQSKHAVVGAHCYAVAYQVYGVAEPLVFSLVCKLHLGHVGLSDD